MVRWLCIFVVVFQSIGFDLDWGSGKIGIDRWGVMVKGELRLNDFIKHSFVPDYAVNQKQISTASRLFNVFDFIGGLSPGCEGIAVGKSGPSGEVGNRGKVGRHILFRKVYSAADGGDFKPLGRSCPGVLHAQLNTSGRDFGALSMNVSSGLLLGRISGGLNALTSSKPSKENQQDAGNAGPKCPKGYICHRPLGMEVATFKRCLQLFSFIILSLGLLGSIVSGRDDDLIPAEGIRILCAGGLIVMAAWALYPHEISIWN